MNIISFSLFAGIGDIFWQIGATHREVPVKGEDQDGGAAALLSGAYDLR